MMPGPKGAKVTSPDPVLESLIVSLHSSRDKVKDQDIAFLTNVLGGFQLHSLVNLYALLKRQESQLYLPCNKEAIKLTEEIIEELSFISRHSNEAFELLNLLNNPHLKALLEAHDAVANKEYDPILPDVPYEVDEDEETIKIVQLVKSNEPLGATIRYNEKNGKILIARVMHGGAADRSGLIRVGDEVQEVNGVNVLGRSPTDVIKILQEKSIDSTITFKLLPAEVDSDFGYDSKLIVRALFDYYPSEDNHIPCREAGIPFRKGEILHIINQDDPNWWQARKDGNVSMRAGLIPGCQLQERRMAAVREHKTVVSSPTGVSPLEEDSEFMLPGGHSSPLLGCSLSQPTTPTKIRNHKNVKKIMYDIKDNTDYDREELPTYEEVAKLYPRPGLFRPIVLIGPPGIGRNELKRRLMALDSGHYKTTIPHTSRPRKDCEVEGQEYYFVPRAEMEAGIRRCNFVEYGEYKGNLYGTSLETIKCIINAGYVCIVNPHPQALKSLRIAEIKPFIIFIKPPDFEVLKETRNRVNARSTFDENNQRGFTDDEFMDILVSSHKIEFLYGHLFDATIVNDSLAKAFQKLCNVSKELQNGPKWVPANWTQ